MMEQRYPTGGAESGNTELFTHKWSGHPIPVSLLLWEHFKLCYFLRDTLSFKNATEITILPLAGF